MRTWEYYNAKIAKKHDIGLPPHGVVSKKPFKLTNTLKGGDKDLSIFRESENNILTQQQK